VITYVNSKEAKLFELAAADLGVESLDIDQYLNSLAQLKAISPKYVRLPLYEEGHEDEEIFLIDANERTIKIPSSFSKNGVGVVSDELAETVWFRINRYFDIKDFGKAAGVVGEELKDGNLHILIQWEAPDGAKGASWAYAIDADTDPEYIYFGWALTADHLTAKAGNIRFAVRIMQYDEGGKIAYSFATQAAAVAVKASLDFDLTDENVEFENVADKIASRLMGGQIAYCPVFAEDGDLPAYVIDLEVPAGAPEGTPASAILSVNAAAPEGDSYDAMAYKWYKKGANDPDFAQIDGEYSPALTVTSSGQYYVVVFGMKEIVDNEEYIFDGENVSEEPVKFKYHTSVASSKSTVCEIPAPIKLEITEDMAEKLVIEDGANLVIVVNRQKINDAIVGDIDLIIEKTSSAEKDLDLDSAEFVAVDLVPVEGVEAQEAVLYTAEEAAAELERATAAGEEPAFVEGDIKVPAVEAVEGYEPPISFDVNENTISIDMHKAEEGYYKITIINKLNGDHEDTLSSVICRVVKPAKVDEVNATLLTADNQPLDAEDGSVARENKIKANIVINGLSDELQIQWYKVVDEQDPNPAEASDDLLIEGANSDVYVPDDDGYFYFKAINKVENTEDSKPSNVIKFAL
jgi:hypothetical protein